MREACTCCLHPCRREPDALTGELDFGNQALACNAEFMIRTGLRHRHQLITHKHVASKHVGSNIKDVCTFLQVEAAAASLQRGLACELSELDSRVSKAWTTADSLAEQLASVSGLQTAFAEDLRSHQHDTSAGD